MTGGVPFEHYLEAKRMVDDRSLNRRVWAEFKDAFSRLDLSSASAPRSPRRVLEIGAGTGTMLDRLWQWNLPGPIAYTGIEPDETLLIRARSRGVPAGWSAEFLHHSLDTMSGSFEAVLANAVLDILPAAESLKRIAALLGPHGLFYATITFDGLTVFEATEAVPENDEVLRAYHLGMDSRMITGEGHGGAEAGRRILTTLPSAGFNLLAAGSSDWVIAPGADGYLPEEIVLLQWLIATIERAVGAALGDSRLDAERRRRGIGVSAEGLSNWVAARRRQLSEGQLVVIAHQLDFCSQRID